MGSRIVIFLLACAGVAFFIERESARGTLDAWERAYLSWLAGNSKQVPKGTDVTVLTLSNTAADGSPGVFDEWPPSALDYALIFENASFYEPRCIAATPVFHWADETDLTAQILAEKTAPLNALVLAAVLQDDPSATAPDAPRIPPPLPAANVSGDHSFLPKFTGTLLAPAAPLLGHPNTSTGYITIDLAAPDAPDPSGSLTVSLLATDGTDVYPSLVLATLMADYGVAAQQVTVELGTTITLGDKARVPIDRAGALHLPPTIDAAVQSIPADTLFLDTEGRELAGLSGEDDPLEAIRDSLVVLAFPPDDTQPAIANNLAAALATVQSGHFPTRLDRQFQYGIWGGLALLGAIIVALRKSSGLVTAFLVATVYSITTILVFGTTTVWWPSAIPLATIALAALVALLLSPVSKPEPRP